MSAVRLRGNGASFVAVIGLLAASAGWVSVAHAGMLTLFDDFESLADWTIVSPGTVEATAGGELRFLDTSGANNSVRRTDLAVGPRYHIEFTSRIDQYSSNNLDALGVRVRDGDHKLELKFRNGGLYALRDNGAGGSTLFEISASVDALDHVYRADVEDGQASVYADGQLLDSFALPGDTASDIVYLWSRGASGNASESHVASLNLVDNATELFYNGALFSVFDKLPADPVSQGSGTFSHEDTYSPEVTAWTAYNLDPKAVWQDTLKHDNSNNSRDWDIRIGRGGQVYSFRTRAGELIPPQEHKGAEWIDEVFQAVTVNTLTNNRDPIAYPSRSFVHQAGTYWLKKYQGIEEELDPALLDHSWYSPTLASHYDAAERSYSTLVWGQYSHVPTIYEARQLTYTRLKDKGDGVIEVTWVITNRGSDTINWLNVPWGGVRNSNLPTQIMSNTDGTYSVHDRIFGKRKIPAEPNDMGIFDHVDTGGWFAWASSDQAGADALGIVFGDDKHWDPVAGDYHWKKAHFKWGRSNNTTRDYNVGVNIMPVEIAPGESFYYRGYMVVGTIEHVVSKGASLKDDVEYGLLSIDETQAATYDYAQAGIVREGNSQTVLTSTSSNRDLALFTDPVDDAVPLFLLEDTATGDLLISDDPHELSTIVTYQNPYQQYLDEEWPDLSGWTVVNNGGTVSASPAGELHLFDTSDTVNAAHRNDISAPSTYRLGFDANIVSVGQTGSDSLGVRVRNGITRLELKFRNGNLYVVGPSGSGLELVKSNIAVNEWHRYEFVLNHNSLVDTYSINIHIDGVRMDEVVDGEVRALAFTLPADTSGDLLYLFVRGGSTAAESRVRNFEVEDTFFDQLTGRQQYKAYDGSTKYLGFLGYAMPSGHTSGSLTYQDLSQVIIDGTYYPNPQNNSLQVLD
ncbi:MAG: hypothetical protein AAFX56_01665 [Pseudomonadota bacterium]